MLNAVLVLLWAGICRQLKGWVMCPTLPLSWVPPVPLQSPAVLPTQCSIWEIVREYFSSILLPQLLFPLLWLSCSSVIFCSYSSFALTYLLAYSGVLVALWGWQIVAILVPTLAFKPCPDSNPRAEVLKMNLKDCSAIYQCKEEYRGISIRVFDSGITVHGSGS